MGLLNFITKFTEKFSKKIYQKKSANRANHKLLTFQKQKTKKLTKIFGVWVTEYLFSCGYFSEFNALFVMHHNTICNRR